MKTYIPSTNMTPNSQPCPKIYKNVGCWSWDGIWLPNLEVQWQYFD